MMNRIITLYTGRTRPDKAGQALPESAVCISAEKSSYVKVSRELVAANIESDPVMTVAVRHSDGRDLAGCFGDIAGKTRIRPVM